MTNSILLLWLRVIQSGGITGLTGSPLEFTAQMDAMTAVSKKFSSMTTL